MKIDSDLRCAIKSSERAQPSTNWETRQNANRKAIADLIERKPSIKKALSKAKVLDSKSDLYRAMSRKLVEPFGICINDNSRIDDESNFVKSGGKLPLPPKRHWKADEVIAELAAASPKHMKSILAKYSIRWD